MDSFLDLSLERLTFVGTQPTITGSVSAAYTPFHVVSAACCASRGCCQNTEASIHRKENFRRSVRCVAEVRAATFPGWQATEGSRIPPPRWVQTKGVMIAISAAEIGSVRRPRNPRRIRRGNDQEPHDPSVPSIPSSPPDPATSRFILHSVGYHT